MQHGGYELSNEALRDTVHPGPSDKSVSSSYALPHSPIEERHIDFVLEEEFACNQEFLTFLLKLPRESAGKSKAVPTVDNDHSLLMQPNQEADCQSARSVTTDFGETEVLLT